jgi:transglutaminase-like putative cysteine protease
MLPRDLESPFVTVKCQRSRATVRPEPEQLVEHLDYFGNRVLSFAIESLHQELEVGVQSEVSVAPGSLNLNDDQTPWERVRRRVDQREDSNWFEIQEYQFDSPRVQRGPLFADYAQPSFAPGRPIFEAAFDLTRRIHADFDYDTKVTDVNTTPEEALEMRAGVCQDFSHVQIACLRSLGLPARYVSGYLRTVPPPGKERLVGADQSHAWVSLYAGESLGWIDLDPTNCCVSDVNHVPICIGRDYSEVSPMRGVVLGGGDTHLKVSVDVEPVG